MRGLVGFAVGLLAITATFADPLTPSEKRGREIYLHGKGNARPITAFFGSDDAGAIDASIVPCASCHGADGRGVPEGTVAPSDIRWNVLSKPYLSPDGSRRRVRYDTPLLSRAVREGLDAGGNPVYAVMPRYGIDQHDLDDLLGYLRRLGNEPQPGLDDTGIKVGTAFADPVMRTVVGAAFDDLNEKGGLFGRRLTLETADGGVFGIVGAASSGVAPLVESERIPLVTPFAAAPESRAAVSAFVLFPDLESQALALLDFAAEREGKKPLRVAVLHDGSKLADAAANAAARRCASLGWIVTRSAPDILLSIGNVDLAGAAATIGAPQILVAGAVLSPALFDLRGKSIFVAAPTLPSDVSDDGREEFGAFAARHRLPPERRAAQIAAYAAAKVFIEALRRSGRELTREKVIASLEHFYEFATELTPALTFGPNHHVGAVGAYVVGVDFDRRTFSNASRWITPAE